ncbi:MAG: hypothetical protein A2Y72_05660 [Chloroflexi bacterium RBG_13_53_26]|nr:MAG: hypothetical protein A2Y72_05660 [Chloroflexi bacterium RBG_13_53_26]
MYCSRCGQQNSDQAQFCQRCGVAIGTAAIVGHGGVYAEPYRSARRLALILTILFCIVILIIIIAIVLDLVLINLLSGSYVSSRDMQLNEDVQAAIGTFQFVAFIVTTVFFLIWIYRTHGNLPRLGSRNLQYSPAWAIAGFFIPFVNLVLPFLVVQEIWKASDPRRIDGFSWKDTPLSLRVLFWWILFLVGVIGPLVMIIAFGGGDEVADVLNWTWARLVFDVLDIPRTILAILVVRGIVSRQDEKHSSLAGPAPLAD